MAESVSKTGPLISLCGGILLLTSSCMALAADSLPDPTRPPAVRGTGNTVQDVASGPVLQSVLISPGRRVAVISGQTVQQGDRLGDARVAKIVEGEVLLHRGTQSQILKLFPGIEKRQVTGGATVRDIGRRQ